MATAVHTKLRDDPQFFMLKGISAEENHSLQDKAGDVISQLFRRRVKNPVKLVADFREALRYFGFIRVRAKIWCHDVHFRASVGAKLRPKLKSRFRKPDDILYGFTTLAARRAGLDPRHEDVGVWMDGKRVEGSVHVIPFKDQTAALDKMLAQCEKCKTSEHRKRNGQGLPQT